MTIKTFIEELLNDNPAQLTFKINGGVGYTANHPNRDEEYATQIILEDDGVYCQTNLSDGCKKKIYIPYEHIIAVDSLYGCPESEMVV